MPRRPAVRTNEVIGEREEVSTGYVAREHQRILHQSFKRFSVVVCHRRFGKTVGVINHMVDRAHRLTLPMPRFAYLAPTYGQAKRVAWDYLKMYTSHIPGVLVNENDLRIDLPHNKARIMLLSAENPMSLKGIYLDGCILDEYGEMNPTTWREAIRPTLSDRLGWATFIGTPKGQNNFWELYEYATKGNKDGVLNPEWMGAMFKASETGILPESELRSARETMTEEEYEQEYECSFLAGLVGAYFSKELRRAADEKRICSVPHDPGLPVDTYWDLGINDCMAIWFVQSKQGRHDIIDYAEWSGAGIPDVLADMQKKPYVYGMFGLPHDVEVRDIGTGQSRLQVYYDLGCRNITVIPRVQRKMESVDAARRIFAKCRFDEAQCAEGLKRLANYQRKWNSKGNVFEANPLHNWASNCADAFQQFAMGARENTRGSGLGQGSEPMPAEAEADYDPYSF